MLWFLGKIYSKITSTSNGSFPQTQRITNAMVSILRDVSMLLFGVGFPPTAN